jgi:hypothetical protein
MSTLDAAAQRAQDIADGLIEEDEEELEPEGDEEDVPGISEEASSEEYV